GCGTRRRMGRRRADRSRECEESEPRASRLDGSARISTRDPLRSRHFRSPVPYVGGGPSRMGVAHSLSDQHRSRGGWTLHPSAIAGNAGVSRAASRENRVARLPLVEVLTKEPRAFFTAIGLKLSEISYAMIAGVFAINYVTVRLAMPRSVILNAVFVSSVVALFAIPLFGWISDRIGRKAMFYAGT